MCTSEELVLSLYHVDPRKVNSGHHTGQQAPLHGETSCKPFSFENCLSISLAHLLVGVFSYYLA